MQDLIELIKNNKNILNNIDIKNAIETLLTQENQQALLWTTLKKLNNPALLQLFHYLLVKYYLLKQQAILSRIFIEIIYNYDIEVQKLLYMDNQKKIPPNPHHFQAYVNAFAEQFSQLLINPYQEIRNPHYQQQPLCLTLQPQENSMDSSILEAEKTFVLSANANIISGNLAYPIVERSKIIGQLYCEKEGVIDIIDSNGEILFENIASGSYFSLKHGIKAKVISKQIQLSLKIKKQAMSDEEFLDAKTIQYQGDLEALRNILSFGKKGVILEAITDSCTLYDENETHNIENQTKVLVKFTSQDLLIQIGKQKFSPQEAHEKAFAIKIGQLKKPITLQYNQESIILESLDTLIIHYKNSKQKHVVFPELKLAINKKTKSITSKKEGFQINPEQLVFIGRKGDTTQEVWLKIDKRGQEKINLNTDIYNNLSNFNTLLAILSDNNQWHSLLQGEGSFKMGEFLKSSMFYFLNQNGLALIYKNKSKIIRFIRSPFLLKKNTDKDQYNISEIKQQLSAMEKDFNIVLEDLNQYINQVAFIQNQKLAEFLQTINKHIYKKIQQLDNNAEKKLLEEYFSFFEKQEYYLSPFSNAENKRFLRIIDEGIFLYDKSLLDFICIKYDFIKNTPFLRCRKLYCPELHDNRLCIQCNQNIGSERPKVLLDPYAVLTEPLYDHQNEIKEDGMYDNQNKEDEDEDENNQ